MNKHNTPSFDPQTPITNRTTNAITNRTHTPISSECPVCMGTGKGDVSVYTRQKEYNLQLNDKYMFHVNRVSDIIRTLGFKVTEHKEKLAAAKARLTKATNKLREAERVAAGLLDFGENEKLLEMQREKVRRLQAELSLIESETPKVQSIDNK